MRNRFLRLIAVSAAIAVLVASAPFSVFAENGVIAGFFCILEKQFAEAWNVDDILIHYRILNFVDFQPSTQFFYFI